MKKLILTSALVMVVTFGSSFEKEKPKLSEKRKTEIAKKSKDKVYFWEVTSSGYTTSRRLAKKSIKQAAKGAIISSKIIESYETVTTTNK